MRLVNADFWYRLFLPFLDSSQRLNHEIGSDYDMRYAHLLRFLTIILFIQACRPRWKQESESSKTKENARSVLTTWRTWCLSHVDTYVVVLAVLKLFESALSAECELRKPFAHTSPKHASYYFPLSRFSKSTLPHYSAAALTWLWGFRFCRCEMDPNGRRAMASQNDIINKLTLYALT